MDPYHESKTRDLYGGYQFRDLTPDGLPMDASMAVPAFSMVDQPVYRSLDVLRDVSAAPSVFEVQPLRQKEDARSAVMVPTQSKPVIEVVSNLPPSVDSLMCPLERTHFDVSESLEELQHKLTHFCDAESVQVDSQAQTQFELGCTAMGDDSFESCEFRINLFTRETKLVVEFQRRSGDSLLFNQIVRSAKAHFHKCPTQQRRGLTRAALPMDFEPSSEDIAQEWACMLSWLQTDRREAIRAIGALANQGALVPDAVMAALVDLLSECRVDALRAITAAVPKHRLSGHEDRVLAAVLQCMNGGLLEQKEAWRFVAKVAGSIPTVLSNHKIDEETFNRALESRWMCIQQFAQNSMQVIQCQS